MVNESTMFEDRTILTGIALMLLGIILIIIANFPLFVLDSAIIGFPIILMILAGWLMHSKNSQPFTIVFRYSAAAFLLAASIELIFVFFFLSLIGQMDVYSTIQSNLQGLAFPIAIFGLASSTLSGIESNIAIRNDLSQIKEHLG